MSQDGIPLDVGQHADMLCTVVLNMAASAKRAVQRNPELRAFLPPAGAAMLTARFQQFGDAMAYASLCHQAYETKRDPTGYFKQLLQHYEATYAERCTLGDETSRRLLQKLRMEFIEGAARETDPLDHLADIVLAEAFLPSIDAASRTRIRGIAELLRDVVVGFSVDRTYFQSSEDADKGSTAPEPWEPKGWVDDMDEDDGGGDG